MAKKNYSNPILLDVSVDGDGSYIITFDGSNVTTGVDNIFTFQGEDFTEELVELIDVQCSYFDLQDMAGDDYTITYEEFLAWLENNDWFDPGY